MGVKMILRIIVKNLEADPEKGFSQNRFKSPTATQWPGRQRWSQEYRLLGKERVSVNGVRSEWIKKENFSSEVDIE